MQPEAPSPDQLTSEKIGLFEIVLAPRSRATGKTLRGIHCREKYDLNVIAIWRNGRPRRVGLGDITLQLGDALLVLGSRDRARVVQSEGEFILFPQHTPRQSRRSQ